MESPEYWDSLTALVACCNTDDPPATLERLSWAGLIGPTTEAQCARLAAAFRKEREREITGPSTASRIAHRLRDEGVASVAASMPDPGARWAAAEAEAFGAGARLRACTACGTLGIEWWRAGVCACGARRVVPQGSDTTKLCRACARVSPVAAAWCEACGRSFDAAPHGPRTRVEVLQDGAIFCTAVVDLPHFTIGRDPETDVPVKSSTVARRHVVVAVDGEDWLVEDQGSPGGIHFGGQQVRGRVRIRAGQEIALGPLRVRFVRLEPARAECEAIALESEHWRAPATAAEIQVRTARLCRGLELAHGPSFLEATTLLPASEALIGMFHETSSDVVSAGLGAAMRARLLCAAETPRAAARAVAGAYFDHHDGFERLARLVELLEALPEHGYDGPPVADTRQAPAPAPPPVSPRPRVTRPAARDGAVSRWRALSDPAEVERLHAHLLARFDRIARSWTAFKESFGSDVADHWDDYDLAKGNARFATVALVMLRELDLARLRSPEALLEAAARILDEAPEDPDYDPPRPTQRDLTALVDALYRDGLTTSPAN